jgi:succinate dehydrogenase / fumarate reductase cytochrome b subunit
MNSTNQRPLSPHLTIWKWGWNMSVSILHRVTGGALTVAGLAVLTWWLASLAGGAAEYAGFAKIIDHWALQLVLLGLTWAFWQHFLSGIRHIVMDVGAGYELKVNRFWAMMTIVGALFLTALTWASLSGYLAAILGGAQ